MVCTRLRLILSLEELGRLTISEFAGNTTIVVDVHGMKCSQARRLINNIINTVRCAARLVIIHGYNHGTAIKEMLTCDFHNSHIEKQFPDACNLGMTHMLIAA